LDVALSDAVAVAVAVAGPEEAVKGWSTLHGLLEWGLKHNSDLKPPTGKQKSPQCHCQKNVIP
jgi:hypothetical protein